MKKLLKFFALTLAALLLAGCRSELNSDDPISIPVATPEAIVEIDPNHPTAMLADVSYSTPGMSLTLGHSKDGLLSPLHSYSPVDIAVNAEHYFDYTIKLLTWEESQSPFTEQADDCSYVMLTGDRWTLTAYEGMEAVYFCPPNGAAWYLPTQGDYPVDVYRCLRQWLDEAEYQPLAAALSVPDRGQGYEAAAKEYMALSDALHLQVNEGSIYRYSYSKSAVIVDELSEAETQRLREQGRMGDNEWCIAIVPVFVPENDAALACNMAGNTDLYRGNDPQVPEGAFQKELYGVITLEDGAWTLTFSGTSW